MCTPPSKAAASNLAIGSRIARRFALPAMGVGKAGWLGSGRLRIAGTTTACTNMPLCHCQRQVPWALRAKDSAGRKANIAAIARGCSRIGHRGQAHKLECKAKTPTGKQASKHPGKQASRPRPGRPASAPRADAGGCSGRTPQQVTLSVHSRPLGCQRPGGQPANRDGAGSPEGPARPTLSSSQKKVARLNLWNLKCCHTQGAR